ncbi:3D domain-containing protein [Bacillus mycoides]|uniref:3D domain-containing protein n=1 Tax=Bacillus mycoides TaxID=1405 RepID=UPI003D029CEA
MVKNSSSKRGVSGRRIALVGTLSALVMTSGGLWYNSEQDYDRLESTYSVTKAQLLKQEDKVAQQEKEINNLNSNLKSVTNEKKLIDIENESLEQEKNSLTKERDALIQEKQNIEAEFKAEREKNSAKKTKEYSEAKEPEVQSAPQVKKDSGDNGYQGWKKMNVQATGYSNVADELGGGDLTAIGTGVRWGVIAVDPSVIPLGSTVYIPAFGQTFIAEDTGGVIKGNIIDIFFNHGDQARTWGRKNIEIYVQPK